MHVYSYMCTHFVYKIHTTIVVIIYQCNTVYNNRNTYTYLQSTIIELLLDTIIYTLYFKNKYYFMQMDTTK